MDPPSFTQTTGRVYEDGGQADSVLVVDSNTVTLDVGKTYLARIEIEETASELGTFTAQWEFNHESAGYVNLTTTSSVIKAVTTSTLRDDKATTDRITSSGRTFQAGNHSVDGLNTAVSGLNNEHTELLVGIEIIAADVSDTDEILLRVQNTHADGGPAAFTQVIDITVNIPTNTLPGQVWNAQSGTPAESVGFSGPHADGNGHLWYFGEAGVELSASEPDPVARKSVDGGKTWILVDQVNQPTNTMRDLEAFHVNRSRIGPVTTGALWVARCATSAFDTDFLEIFTDDHASTPNTWSTSATVEATGTAGGDEEFAAPVERSDGDIITLYGQTISTFTRVVAQQQAAGTFSAQFNVDTGTASTHYSHGRLSLGASDRVAVVYYDRTNAALDARDIPDNSTTPGTVAAGIEGAQTVKNYVGGAMTQPIVDILQFNADDKHLVIWLDNSDNLYSVVLTWDGSKYTAGTPEQVSATSVESDYPTTFDTTGVNAGMAVDYDTGAVYCLFIDATNRDIYRTKWTENGGWEAEVKVFTATGDADRAAYIMPTVFTHAEGNGGKKVLGWVWIVVDRAAGDADGDGAVEGQARYDEYEIPTLAYDADSTSDTTAATSLTFSHTCTGTDRCLIVGVQTYDGGSVPAIPTVTYDGISMTEITNTLFGASDDERVALYYLVAPATGANNVVVTVSPAQDEIVAGAVSFTGADQTTPVGTPGTDVTDNVTSHSTTITDGATGDMVIDVIANYNGTQTVGAAQTERVVNDNGASIDSIYMSTEPGAASVVMSWSWAVAEWAGQIAVNVFAASAAAAVYPPWPRRQQTTVRM